MVQTNNNNNNNATASSHNPHTVEAAITCNSKVEAAITCNSKVEAARILKVEVPEEFICPITLEVMSHPMLFRKTGHNFERSAIKAWLRKQGHHHPSGKSTTCPLTRLPLQWEDLESNVELENAIQFWTWEFHIPESEWTVEPGSDRLMVCYHNDKYFLGKAFGSSLSSLRSNNDRRPSSSSSTQFHHSSPDLGNNRIAL
jgi:U-box domain